MVKLPKEDKNKIKEALVNTIEKVLIQSGSVERVLEKTGEKIAKAIDSEHRVTPDV